MIHGTLPISKRKDFSERLLFVHSDLDDYGLTASQFRIYARVSRRAGDHGCCFQSVPKMAKECRLEKKTVTGCLASLVELGFLRKEKVEGKSCNYFIQPRSQWKEPNPGGQTGRVAKRVGTIPKRHPEDHTQKAPHEVYPTQIHPTKAEREALSSHQSPSLVLKEGTPEAEALINLLQDEFKELNAPEVAAKMFAHYKGRRRGLTEKDFRRWFEDERPSNSQFTRANTLRPGEDYGSTYS